MEYSIAISPTMVCRWPCKHIQNTTGLWNGSIAIPVQAQETADEDPNQEFSLDNSLEADIGVYFDSTRLIIGDDDIGYESDLDVDEEFESEEWEDEELYNNIYSDSQNCSSILYFLKDISISNPKN